MDECLEPCSLDARILMVDVLMTLTMLTMWVCVAGSMRPEHLHAAYYLLD